MKFLSEARIHQRQCAYLGRTAAVQSWVGMNEYSLLAVGMPTGRQDQIQASFPGQDSQKQSQMKGQVCLLTNGS